MMSASEVGEKLFPDAICEPRVKEAIALQMASAQSAKAQKMAGGTPIRSGLNILLVGDPCTGKTTLLRSATNLVERAIYVNRQLPSTILEGVRLLCLDNVDRSIGSEKYVQNLRLLYEEASNHESVSILASALPRFGRFDSGRERFLQIGIPPYILSKTDLVFFLYDPQDPEKDRDYATWLLGKRTVESEPGSIAIAQADAFAHVMKAARISPLMSNEGATLLRDHYIEIRKSGRNGFPASQVTLFILKKLSEAYARMRLSDFIEREDAEAAISLFEYCKKEFLSGQQASDDTIEEIEIKKEPDYLEGFDYREFKADLLAEQESVKGIAKALQKQHGEVCLRILREIATAGGMEYPEILLAVDDLVQAGWFKRIRPGFLAVSEEAEK